MSILKFPELVPTNLPVSEAFLIEHLDTLGVLMLPEDGNSLWNRNFRGVLDQGVEGYVFVCTLPQVHLALSADKVVFNNSLVPARACAIL